MAPAITSRAVRLSRPTGILPEDAVEVRTYGICGACAFAVPPRVLAVAVMFVAVTCGAVHAQDVSEAKRPVPSGRRWTVVMDVGTTSSGPAESVEAAMRTARLGDTCNCFGVRVPHPFSSTGLGAEEFSAQFVARYAVRPAWSVAMVFGDAPIGSTLGYRAPIHFLTVEYGVTTLAAVLSAVIGPIEIGAGPAVYRVHAVGGGDAGALPLSSSVTRLGGLAHVRAGFPTRSRLFLDLTFSYRTVGSISIGPFATSPADPVILPSTSVPYNHWFAAIGPGLRF